MGTWQFYAPEYLGVDDARGSWYAFSGLLTESRRPYQSVEIRVPGTITLYATLSLYSTPKFGKSPSADYPRSKYV